MHIAPHAQQRPRRDLGEAYTTVRTATLRLTEGLSEEDCIVQSMPDASPVKWHLAHTTWFFETFILEAEETGFRPFHPSFRVLFNSYYNGIGAKHPRPERGLVTRPGLAEILRYREDVDARMSALLGRAELSARCRELVELGLHHEQQHQELILTDLKHLFSRNPLRPAYHKPWPLMQVAARTPGWCRIAGGLVQTGHDPAEGFAFDNEGPQHRNFLQDFELAAYPVTNGEFMAFVEDGGYRRPEWWLSLGWDQVQQQRWEAPLYWERLDGRWHAFTLHGLVEVDPNTPACHLSYFEADAYARWAAHTQAATHAGARLPTEIEWEHAARERGAPRRAIDEGNFQESRALHPLPPRQPRAGDSLMQLFGDAWEWTSSSYAPYPGFAPAAGAVGEYNGKFMCNQYVLRGGSCVTPRSHIRASYRNFFPPEARWQFTGLRLARSL